MMTIRLGDLYSLKNHPYKEDQRNIKIAGLASMTPPILVVSEILNSPKQHDVETGIIKPKQVKCIFYSHKSHNFENSWFSVNDIKLIGENNTNAERGEQYNDEIVTKNTVLSKYSNPSIIEEIKKEFLNNQVILKSCDLELGKLKITYSQTEYKSSDKVTAHLNFLPPVLTVIDVKVNDDKISYNPKSGNFKKIFSTYLLKCKWYNPNTDSFSEDYIPIDAIQKIEAPDLNLVATAIINNNIFRHDLRKNEKKIDIFKESSNTLSHIYLQPLEIIFNHYKYQIRYYDIFRDRYSKMDLSALIIDEDKMTMDDLILEKIPEYKKELEDYTKIKDFPFKINQYYRINYRDLSGNITKRIIYLKEYFPNKVLIADCLLRNGEERHFRLDENAILKLEVLNQAFFI